MVDLRGKFWGVLTVEFRCDGGLMSGGWAIFGQVGSYGVFLTKGVAKEVRISSQKTVNL